ncbi:hypothetical protein LTR17_022042 [Elasticomyces elasticus]|nr:hypothetical protein LTR17_022042 [Elasticomyces elasticus]
MNIQQAITDSILQMVTPVVDLIKDLFRTLHDEIKDGIIQIVASLLDLLKELVRTTYYIVVAIVLIIIAVNYPVQTAQIRDAVSGTIGSIFESIFGTIGSFLRCILDSAGTGGAYVYNFVTNSATWTPATNTINTFWQSNARVQATQNISQTFQQWRVQLRRFKETHRPYQLARRVFKQ